jgi:hypothetical protein
MSWKTEGTTHVTLDRVKIIRLGSEAHMVSLLIGIRGQQRQVSRIGEKQKQSVIEDPVLQFLLVAPFGFCQTEKIENKTKRRMSLPHRISSGRIGFPTDRTKV